MSRQYGRLFVSLKQDRAGYGFKGKEPSGRCVIETKGKDCKISLYIQDIKPEIIYKAYIIHCDHTRSEAVHIGTPVIDVKGKAELKLELDADNICGTGMPIESFNVFAVVLPANNELIVPLAGYVDGVVSWKKNFTVIEPGAKTADKAMSETGLREDISLNKISQSGQSQTKITQIDSETKMFEGESADVGFESPSQDEKPLEESEAMSLDIADGISQETPQDISQQTLDESLSDICVPLNPPENKPAEFQKSDEFFGETYERLEIEAGEILVGKIDDLNIGIEKLYEDGENKFEITDAYAAEVNEEIAKTEAAIAKSIKAAEINTDNISSYDMEIESADINDAAIDSVDSNADDISSTDMETEQTNNKSTAEAEAAQTDTTAPPPETAMDIRAAFVEMALSLKEELKELEQIAFVRDDDAEPAEVSAAEESDGHGAPRAEDGIRVMFRDNIPMRPFRKQNIDVNWVRISLRELVHLPIDHWKYMNHPFMVSANNRFRHLILGEYDENNEKRYFLGVPEIYDSSFRKRAMALGFTQFKCCEDVRTANGEYGYWILPIQP